MNVLTVVVGGATDVENFDLENGGPLPERKRERRDESNGGDRCERERDVGEKTMEHGGAWQRDHGGDKYRV